MKSITSLYLIVGGACLLMVSCLTQKKNDRNVLAGRPLVEKYITIRIDKSLYSDTLRCIDSLTIYYSGHGFIEKGLDTPTYKVLLTNNSTSVGEYVWRFDSVNQHDIAPSSSVEGRYQVDYYEISLCSSYGCKAVDSIIVKSSSNVPPFKKTKRATLGLSYFPTMKRYETKDIRVLIRQSKKASLVYKELRNIEKNALELVKSSDTSLIYEMDIDAWKSFRLSLFCDTNDFKVSSIVKGETQRFDKVKGNLWHWKMKAISEHPMALVTLVVEAVSSHNKKNIFTKEIPVEIIHDLILYKQKWKIKILEEPAFTIPTIVVPIVGIIAAIKYTRKRKKKKKEGKEKDRDIY